MGTTAYIAAIALMLFGIGLTVRRWWIVLVACVPALLLFLHAIPRWNDDEGDGHTGASLLFVEMMFVGVPVPALIALGVAVGRVAFSRERRA